MLYLFISGIYYEIQHIFVPFYRKKATTDDEELNDSSKVMKN